MDENNKIFEDKPAAAVEDGKKPLDTASLVLAIRRRKDRRTTAALVLCIIGLVIGVAAHVATTVYLMQLMR